METDNHSSFLSLMELEEQFGDGGSSSGGSSRSSIVKRRGQYAALDMTAMGVDVPRTALDNEREKEEMRESVVQLNDYIRRSTTQLGGGTEEALTAEVSVKRRAKKERKGGLLPQGWERHEDEEGHYFWHVASGTIQREEPVEAETSDEAAAVVRDVRSSRVFEEDFDCLALAEEGLDARRWTKTKLDSEEGHSVMQMHVRSLGWVELEEEDLTPENSSKAVNRCIVQLSTGSTKDLHECIGLWGEGKEVIMELRGGSLKLIQPETDLLLNSQPIHSIRVWGVGRDNGQDFAYVARDKHTRRYMCHVFRCEVEARTIASALGEICKKILTERRTQSSLNVRSRPTTLGDKLSPRRQTTIPESFPTPMEEPRKTLKGCKYLGSLAVDRPSGIDVIHEAIDTLQSSTTEWKTVSVAVAPSTITVSFKDESLPPLECRVRFLSFLGIGEDPRQCAFVMQTAQDSFVAHAFHCEPTAGSLCKTIEAACKLRYQKCLDARPQQQQQQVDEVRSSSIGSTLMSMIGSWTSVVMGKRVQSPSAP